MFRLKSMTSFVTSYARFYSTGSKKSVGFVGMGQMGFPMSGHLLKKYPHSEFYIYDNAPSVTTKFKAEHSDQKVNVCSSPAEVAANADIVVTMLPTPQIVNNVYLGKNGFFESSKSGQLYLDSSTVDPETSKDISKKMAEKGVRAIDAPVSGGILGAIGATLTFMVGSPNQEIFEEAKPVLSTMGKNFVHCGDIGHGQIAKICNNFMLGISMMAACETFNLGKRLGMDPKLLRDIMNTSTGRCWSVEVYPPVPNLLPGVPSSRDYEGGFGIGLMQKDMVLSQNAAQKVGASTFLGATATNVYRHVMNLPGFEKKDFSVIYKWLQDQGRKM